MQQATIFALFLAIFSLARPADLEILNWQYRVSPYYENMYSLLGLDIGERATLHNYRGLGKEKPGDYFMDIFAAPRTIDSAMAKNILTQYQSYLNCEIPQSMLFSAQVCVDTSKYGTRNEYFIRYTDGKSVYVLSGWWPKFIKYYKALSENVKLNENNLTAELKGILKDSKTIDSLKFKKTTYRQYYIYKGLRDNIMVRNYKLCLHQHEGRQKAADLGQPPPMFSPWYNIIEITIYLDKEFIP